MYKLNSILFDSFTIKTITLFVLENVIFISNIPYVLISCICPDNFEL